VCRVKYSLVIYNIFVINLGKIARISDSNAQRFFTFRTSRPSRRCVPRGAPAGRSGFAGARVRRSRDPGPRDQKGCARRLAVPRFIARRSEPRFSAFPSGAGRPFQRRKKRRRAPCNKRNAPEKFALSSAAKKPPRKIFQF